MVNLNANKNHKLGGYVKLELQVSQHVIDKQLMKSLIKYLNGGNIYEKKKNKTWIEYRVTKIADITQKVIPFFNKYPIVGVKALDFADFCKVAEMMK